MISGASFTVTPGRSRKQRRKALWMILAVLLAMLIITAPTWGQAVQALEQTETNNSDLEKPDAWFGSRAVETTADMA
jgi:hypothetical protein